MTLGSLLGKASFTPNYKIMRMQFSVLKEKKRNRMRLISSWNFSRRCAPGETCLAMEVLFCYRKKQLWLGAESPEGCTRVSPATSHQSSQRNTEDTAQTHLVLPENQQQAVQSTLTIALWFPQTSSEHIQKCQVFCFFPLHFIWFAVRYLLCPVIAGCFSDFHISAILRHNQ